MSNGASASRAAQTQDADEHIGVILVHGIGEHRRFEHLDGELRPLISALVRRGTPAPDPEKPDVPPPHVTVEIVEGSASTLHADQDTWSMEAGAPVRVIVRDGVVKKHIHFHEVWWADVNEPYSLWKQVKFWSWGLSIWLVPAMRHFDLPGAEKTMALPVFFGRLQGNEYLLRLRLFCVCNVFAMAAFSLGAVIFFAKRLFNFQAPSIVKIFVNYIGAVKLYSQKKRSDGGFLDAYLEPPRVSIRRRMIRTLADASLARYSRWYVFAHSLGSVVAFNGLMETAHAIPNYLSEKQFRKLTEKVDGEPDTELAGPSRAGDITGDTKEMLPARPLWLAKDEVIYRDRFFDRFRGVLTYGSPLDKFAAIWPARVPINKLEPGLVSGIDHEKTKTGTNRPKAEWINVYDPTDPVAANLDAFAEPPEAAGKDIAMVPVNYGYASHPVLLLSHLHYFDGEQGCKDRLADRLMDWVLSGKSFSPGTNAMHTIWLNENKVCFWSRRIIAWATWIAVYLVLTFLGALTVPLWMSLFVDGGGVVASKIKEVWNAYFTYRTTFELHVFDGITFAIADFVASARQAIYSHGGKEIGEFLWRLGSLPVDGFTWVFGPAGAITRMALYLGLPAVVEEMIKLSLGVIIVVFGAGLFGWAAVFEKQADPPEPGAAPAATGVTAER